MNRALMLGLLSLAASGLACSTSLREFTCTGSEDCESSEAEGFCEANGFCSFADTTCPSDRRYGAASGEDSNQCVEPQLDAGPEGPPDAAVGCAAFGFAILNLDECEGLDFGEPSILGGNLDYTLDTDTGVLSAPDDESITLDFDVLPQNGGPELMLLTPGSLVIETGAQVKIRGSRGLLIVTSGSIRIDGTLIAAGKAELDGPGGNSQEACSQGRGQDGQVQVPGGAPGGSGGGGGGFLTAGGTGSEVLNTDGPSTPGGQGSDGSQTLVPLHGGCAGGKGGGNGDPGVSGGKGGGAGGAIQLVSASTITVNGTISASGGGGSGAGNARAGGGGGGSGGGILLQAATVIQSGIITVNGGGGGEGLDEGSLAEAGQDGSLDSELAARGGASSSVGGNGGLGATPNSEATNGLKADEDPGATVGAGGGGGGGGSIRVVEEG